MYEGETKAIKSTSCKETSHKASDGSGAISVALWARHAQRDRAACSKEPHPWYDNAMPADHAQVETRLERGLLILVCNVKGLSCLSGSSYVPGISLV